MKRTKRLTPRLLTALQPMQGPYLRAPEEGGHRGDFLIASYNIHKCVGSDGRFDPGRIAEVIAEIDPDVIALQEADKRFGRRDGLLDMEAIEKRTGLVPASVSTLASGHGWHGNALLYRSGAITGVERLKLPGAEPRGAIIVDLELEASPLRIIAAHLGLLRHSRKRQLQAIKAQVKTDGPPTLILGDLNEWRIGDRSSLLTLDPHFGPVGAPVPSFPAQFPVFALDRVLSSPGGLVTRIEAHDSPLARVASDHLPIKATIDLARITSGNGQFPRDPAL
ncbi:EEP domain-containing protein [Chelativorans sp. ZYF759]|nr:EEP domain-containing protein [Chelativorans sp. ZYF759]